MTIKLIQELSDAFGPSGFEEEVVSVVKKHSSNLEFKVDYMNNTYLSLKSNTGSRPLLMLDAHLDEVGFMVQSILGNGLISFIPIGGWIPSNVPAHTVLIKNQKGQKIRGIVASKPPHFMTDGEKTAPLSLDQLTIDVGASSREEVMREYAIQIGDPIAPEVSFEYNKDSGIMFGKAFDNRLGCAALMMTMEALAKLSNLPFDVIGALASQEEVGTRGAQVTAQVVKPDVAIVFEGSPADDLYMDKDSAQCVLNRGTQIRHMDASYISHHRLIQFAKKVANDHHIPYQSAVRKRGGTNAGRIHMAHQGVPVLVLGVPSRYIHTHYNFAAINDLEATVALAKQVALQLDLTSLVYNY